ncbi:MAG: zinc-dependent alcohol dehydrogenase [Anaerolineae bacterium]
MPRAAVLLKPGKIAIVEQPACQPGFGEVEVSVRFVGICGSDLARFAGRIPVGKEVVLGHELSGRVSALGVGMYGWQIGQAVTVAPLLNCGQCDLCLNGHEQLCPQRRIFGGEVDGALRERICVPSNRVFPLPMHLRLEEGAMVEPLAVAVHAVRQACESGGLDYDSIVTVLGAGAIGLLIAQVVRLQGVTKILVADTNPARLQLANEFEFTVMNPGVCDPVGSMLEHTKGHGSDVLFEATGSPAVARYFTPMLAARGTIVVVGHMEQPVSLDLEALLLKEGRLLTSRYFTIGDFEQAVEMLAERSISVAPLIQRVVPFECLGERQGALVMDAARQVVRLLIEFKGN